MHWLQTIDTGLFHFINRSLGNPLFDGLMPVLSGHDVPWFIPLAVAAVLGTLIFGGARARLCALLVGLVVALGDPLVINTIKQGLGRPRPCLALPDVVGRLGCSGGGSMPSAHAANWFAMTMVMFLFYRRSWRFMLPLALGVSFSRVYCGVHYPSDVLAGAILGAGYAAALAWGLEHGWRWAGRKWFPAWHDRMPSLINPVGKPQPKEGDQPSVVAVPPHPGPLPEGEGELLADSQRSDHARDRSDHGPDFRGGAKKAGGWADVDGVEWVRLGYVLIAVLLVGRWLYLASGLIGLSEDEAYQWLWSKHLALSYYSKPPGIAFLQHFSTALWGDTVFGVRFCSPLCGALTGVLLLRFMAREVGPRPAFWLLVIVTATPLLDVGAVLMTIDPPLVLFWTAAMVAGWRAVQPDGRASHWLLAGAALGLGFLFKYTAMLQIICWAIYFVIAPAARKHLRKPGPWLALLVFLGCTTPVLVWNAQHHWITVEHVAGNAGMDKPWQPTLKYFWEFTASEFALLNPFFFIGAVWAGVGFWKLRAQPPLYRFLFCMGTTIFLGHWLFSFHSRVLPNWIAVSVLPMFCLMVAYGTHRPRAARIILIGGVALGLVASVFLHDSDLIGKLYNTLPGEADQSHRLRAWAETAGVVEAEREKLATPAAPAFIIADHYGRTGELTFYSPPARDALRTEPLVYCVVSAQPANQFYFWPEYDYRRSRQGQNAIYASLVSSSGLEDGWFWHWLKREPIATRPAPDEPVPQLMAEEFEMVTDLGVREVTLNDRVFHRVHLWACHHLK